MSKPTRAAVMARAASEIGYHDNTGARYWRDVYPAWVGGAFCACFAAWCFEKEGGGAPAPGITGMLYTPTLRAVAQSNGTYLAPSSDNLARLRSGDLVTYDWQDDGVTDHVSFFERNRPDLGRGYFQTIESNTSSGQAGSQSNGRGTWRRIRHISDVSALIDASYLYAGAAEAKPQTLSGLSGDVAQRLQTVLNARGAHLVVDGIIGAETIKAWQAQMGTPADGVVSGPESLFVQSVQGYLNRLRASLVARGKSVQPEWEDLAVDGVWGTRSATAVATYLMKWNGGFSR